MYQFHLESVLKYRGNIEKGHIQEMSELRSALAEEERVLTENVRKVGKVSDDLARKEKEGIISKEASVYRSFLEKINDTISEQKRKTVDIELAIEKKRVELVKTAMDKKIMEKLKDKDRKTFFLELRKKDQKAMDDIASKR